MTRKNAHKRADVSSLLTGKEKRLLMLRYGIGDERPRTLEEVGRAFHVTREAIRKQEQKALRKLRHPHRVRGT